MYRSVIRIRDLIDFKGFSNFSQVFHNVFISNNVHNYHKNSGSHQSLWFF